MRVDAFRRLVDRMSAQVLDAEAHAARDCAERHGSGPKARDYVSSFYGRHASVAADILGCSLEAAQSYCREQRDTVIARGWDAARSEGRDKLARLAWAGLGGCEMESRELYAMVPEVLAQWLARASSVDPVAAMREHTAAAITPQRRTSGAVAVIPVRGMITQRPTLFSALFGGTSTVGLADAVEAAVADTSIGAILLDVDSPGGSVMGVTEAHARIRAARGVKPIVAIADPQSASAAYWLSAAADSIYLTPSGMAGSIGVITQHVDASAALEREGLRVTTISYGKHKADGDPSVPLSEDVRAAIQADVDYYGRQFEADVAKGRGIRVAKVQRDFGQGAQLTAEAALASGLVDGILSLEELLGKMAKGWKPAAARAEAEEPEIKAEAPVVAPVAVAPAPCDANLWAIRWGL